MWIETKENLASDPMAKGTFFCSLDDINSHEGDILTWHVCITEEKALKSVL